MSGKRPLFLILGVCAVALIALAFSSCSGSTTPNPPGGTSRAFTSSSNNSHTHSVTLQRTEVETPPAGGIAKTTTSNSAHTHSFAMTQAELDTVDGGGSVTVTSGSSDVGGAHTHTFTITKWF